MVKSGEQKSGKRKGWIGSAIDFRRDYERGPVIGKNRYEQEAAFSKLEEHDQAVRQTWKGVQSFILRGLCGGLVASLTVVGSQIFTGPLKSNVAVLTTIFIAGLVIQGFRMIIDGFGALERFHSLSMPLSRKQPGFEPGKGWSFLPVLLDALSMIILICAVCFALILLFRLTQ